VNPGSTITVTVANGPANEADWVALFSTSGDDNSYGAWKYLSDGAVPPATGLSSATLHFTAPAIPGTYNFRFFAGTTKLATSATVTVQGPAPPALTVSPTTVSSGGTITVIVTNGPGNVSDWVALLSTSAGDGSYLTWKYLSDTGIPPATGLSGATLHFTAPTTPGTYNLRFFAGTTKLATSATVTVQ
jgi:hypothetical protein